MVDGISGNLQIPIGPTEGDGVDDKAASRRLVWRKLRDGDQPDQIIVDLFPRAFGVNAKATSGTLNGGSSLSEDVLEYLTFSNNTRVQLKFSNPSFLSLTKIGSLRNEDGNLVISNVTFDSDTSEIVINKPAYGVVKAEYTAPFTRYVYQFSGNCPPSPPEINPATGEQEEIFDRATLIGIWNKPFQGKAVTTLSVTNPNTRCPFPQIKGEANNFVIEIAKQDWTSLLTSGLKFQTRIHIFPAGLATDVNVGRQGESGEAGSIAGIQVCSDETITIKNEFLSYNNSPVSSLRYPLDDIGLDDIEEDTAALKDEFGVEVNSPTFKFPGDLVELVDWTSSASFTTTGKSVIVKKGEVYVTDPSGRARPVFGTLRANYTATFDRYVYTHAIDKEGSGDNTEAVALGDVVTVKGNDLTGIAVIPPVFKGIASVSGGTGPCDF